MTILRLRRLEALAAVLDAGASRPTFLARVAGALVLGREALSARSWQARGVDVERGVAVALGAREADGRWPAGLAFAVADAAALLRWLGAEGLTGTPADGVVRCGVAGAAAQAALAGSAAEGALAELEAPVSGGKLSAVLDAGGRLTANVDLAGHPRIDALSGALAVATVKTSRVPGFAPRDHVLVAHGIAIAGAPVLTAARDLAATGQGKVSSVLGAVPWPTPWHAHPLLRVFRVS